MKQLCSACLILVAVTVGCTGDEQERAQKLQERSVAADAKPLREALITNEEIRKQPRDSVGRAFLQHWSLLQYQAWATSLESYEEPLKSALGPGRLVEALKTQASLFRSSRPRIRRSVERGDRVTIGYLIESGTSDPIPHSMIWIRTAAGWQIFYDSFLDEAMRLGAQRATQLRIDPTDERPSAAAIREGEAASRLQTEYLRRRLSEAPK